jgi:hypothetical protein
MITPSVDADKIRLAISELRDIDKKLIADLRKDLRTRINPLAKEVAAAVPVRPSISFTPGKSRKSGDHLVSIRINPQKGTRGLYVAELAGTRTQGKNRRGNALIRNLEAKRAIKGTGGRYAYSKFRSLRPDAINIAAEILRQAVKRVNRRLGI